MPHAIPGESRAEAGGPALVAGSWYRFRPGERIHNEHVMSVCMMVTVSGTGTVICNGQTFRASADSVLRFPWAHDVEYRASGSTPFHVGTVHVIPWYAHGADFVARAAFRKGDPLLHSPERTAGEFETSVASIPAHSSAGARLAELAAHSISRFLADRIEERPLRALGELLLDESDAWDRSRADRQLPAALDLMTRFIVENLQAPLTMRAIAEAGSVSTATAERLFARHTGTSALAWVRQRRMSEAAALLRSSSTRVSEVAGRVGFADPFYFSRVFTKTFGIPPSRYADRLVRP